MGQNIGHRARLRLDGGHPVVVCIRRLVESGEDVCSTKEDTVTDSCGRNTSLPLCDCDVGARWERVHASLSWTCAVCSFKSASKASRFFWSRATSVLNIE